MRGQIAFGRARVARKANFRAAAGFFLAMLRHRRSDFGRLPVFEIARADRTMTLRSDSDTGTARVCGVSIGGGISVGP